MRRALHNIAELIRRLDAIGYEFWNEEYAYFSRKDHSGPTPPGSQDPTVSRRSTAEEIVSLHQAGERGMAVPLSLQAWVEEAGVVDLCGAHPALCFYLGRSNWPNVFAEPMMVKPQFEKRGYGPRPASEEVPFSLGRQSKAALPLRTFEGYDNYYALTLPNAAADGTFYAGRRQQFFVEYLRTCFRWGGFPGWENYAERPEKELAFLRDGLLPI
jgi:hypothetical protein